MGLFLFSYFQFFFFYIFMFFIGFMNYFYLVFLLNKKYLFIVIFYKFVPLQSFYHVAFSAILLYFLKNQYIFKNTKFFKFLLINNVSILIMGLMWSYIIFDNYIYYDYIELISIVSIVILFFINHVIIKYDFIFLLYIVLLLKSFKYLISSSFHKFNINKIIVKLSYNFFLVNFFIFFFFYKKKIMKNKTNTNLILLVALFFIVFNLNFIIFHVLIGFQKFNISKIMISLRV